MAGWVTLGWEAPEGLRGRWKQVEIAIGADDTPLYVESVDYAKGEVRIPREVFDRGIGEYRIDFRVDGKTVIYPLFDYRGVEKAVPVIEWKLPDREWSEGKPIGKDVFPAAAFHEGQQVEGTFKYAGASGEMRGRDRQLLRATFTPTDLDRFGIAVAFRSLKIQDSLRQTSETGGSFKPHQRLTDNRLISDATAGRRGGKQASRRAEGGNLVKSFVDREPRASVVGPTPSLTLEGGTARIEFETEVGKTYRLEYSATLDSPQWQSLGSREGTGDNEVIEVPLRDHSSGFFRMLHHQGVQPSADSIDG